MTTDVFSLMSDPPATVEEFRTAEGAANRFRLRRHRYDTGRVRTWHSQFGVRGWSRPTRSWWS